MKVCNVLYEKREDKIQLFAGDFGESTDDPSMYNFGEEWGVFLDSFFQSGLCVKDRPLVEPNTREWNSLAMAYQMFKKRVESLRTMVDDANAKNLRQGKAEMWLDY